MIEENPEITEQEEVDPNQEVVEKMEKLSEELEKITEQETMSNKEAQEMIDSGESIAGPEVEITEREEEFFAATQKVIEKTVLETIDECILRVRNTNAPRFRTAKNQKDVIVDELNKMRSDFVETLEGE